MRMGEKLHKLREDLRQTQNQLRELAESILCSMDLDSDACRARTSTPRDPHLHVPALANTQVRLIQNAPESILSQSFITSTT